MASKTERRMPVLDARTAADTHEAAVASLREAYAALPPGAPVRLAKRTSNLFRFRDAARCGAAGGNSDGTGTSQVQAAASQRAAWMFPRSATCCALIPTPGRHGSEA
jgi:hypothetical protein